MAQKEPKQTVVTELKETKNAMMQVDPTKLLIVGVDFGGPGDAYYDERVNLPLDDSMIASIKEHGVITPILAKRDGERYIVINGRRRVMHARAINYETQAANPGATEDMFIRVPTIFRQGEVAALEALSNITNAYAVTDPTWMQAVKIQRALDRGADKAAVCRMFGISGQTFEERKQILDLGPEALDALKAGEISNNAAVELAKLNMVEQVRALREARDQAIEQGRRDGKLTLADVRGQVDRRRNSDTASDSNKRATPRDKLAAILKELMAVVTAVGESPKPTTPDKRSASMPEPAMMFQALRKVYRLAHPDAQTFDAAVKAAIPKPEDDEQPVDKGDKADKGKTK